MFINKDVVTLCEAKKKAEENSYWMKTKDVTVKKEFLCPGSTPSCYFYIPNADKPACSAAWTTQDASPLNILPTVPQPGNMFWNVSIQ